MKDEKGAGTAPFSQRWRFARADRFRRRCQRGRQGCRRSQAPTDIRPHESQEPNYKSQMGNNAARGCRPWERRRCFQSSDRYPTRSDHMRAKSQIIRAKWGTTPRVDAAPGNAAGASRAPTDIRPHESQVPNDKSQMGNNAARGCRRWERRPVLPELRPIFDHMRAKSQIIRAKWGTTPRVDAAPGNAGRCFQSSDRYPTRSDHFRAKSQIIRAKWGTTPRVDAAP